MSGLNGLWKYYVSEVTMTLDEYKAVLALQQPLTPLHNSQAGIDAIEQLLYKYWAELGLPKRISIVGAINDYNAIPNVLNLALNDLSEEDQFTYIMAAGYPE
ncbi:hypothetical protein ACLHZ0_20245 [Aeromonas salmonicida]|uniref:hypothetical protein n=1 Tax=Aeromonas salmonicida TaxID=645 RepID=UPI003CFF960E